MNIFPDDISYRGHTSSKLHWVKLTDITNDEKVFKEFIEPLIPGWKSRYEKLVDGYAWI